MPLAASRLVSFEDFLTLHGDNPRYELADGEIIDMEPTGFHETVCQLVGDDYQKQQFRLADPIVSPLLPHLSVRLGDVMPR